MLIHSVQQYSQLPETCTCQSLFHEFLEDFFLNKFIYFIYLFLAALGLCSAHGLSVVVVSGDYSSLRCVGFSLWWLLLLRSTGSRCLGFSSCGTRAQ